MPITYETTATITLNLGQLLSLECALFDAAEHNDTHLYPQTAADIRALRKFIRTQVEQEMQGAAEHLAGFRTQPAAA